jgi:hypothetical protein
MADASDLVKHSLLSLAATYVMDFRQYPQLTARSNFHHQMAIEHLSREIQRSEVYCPKKEDALIAALYILAHNEVNTPTVAGLMRQANFVRLECELGIKTSRNQSKVVSMRHLG